MRPVFLWVGLAAATAIYFASQEDKPEFLREGLARMKALFSTPYDQLIEESALSAGVDSTVLWNLLYAESRFRPDIIDGRKKSHVGAMGIAQFMPATAREWLGSEAAALDPQIAIPGAARYLGWLQRRLGSTDAAVAAYNWGIGNVQRKGLKAAPAETVAYVKAITGTDITA